MDPSLRALVAATERANWMDELAASRARAFSVELDRRGLFLRIGRVEAYLCTEADRAWSFCREPGGLDAQAWRLHLVVGAAPNSN
jgi:hypothetical protein